MTNQVNLNSFNSLQVILAPSHPPDWKNVQWSQYALNLIAEITDHLSLDTFFYSLRDTDMKYRNYSDSFYFVEEHLAIMLSYDFTQPNEGITMSMSIETLKYLTKAHTEYFQKGFDIFKQLEYLSPIVSIQKLSLC